MWNNNIAPTSYLPKQNQNIENTIADQDVSNQFQHNTVDKTTIIILPSIAIKKLTKNQKT